MSGLSLSYLHGGLDLCDNNLQATRVVCFWIDSVLLRQTWLNCGKSVTAESLIITDAYFKRLKIFHKQEAHQFDRASDTLRAQFDKRGSADKVVKFVFGLGLHRLRDIRYKDRYK